MQGAPEERADEEEAQVAGMPYKEILEDEGVNVRTSIVILRQSDLANYASVSYMYRETAQALEREEVLMKYDLFLDGKKQQLMVVKREDRDAADMTPEMFAFDETFVDIGVQVTDISGAQIILVPCLQIERTHQRRAPSDRGICRRRLR